MDIVVSTDQILWFCGLITALWGVWTIVKEIKKPSQDLKEEVENHARLLDADDERLKEIEKADKMMLQCLLVIINHEITGNSIDNMKKVRDELQEYLIAK